MSRRKNREINVFSTSAIDLFASALGVFIILVMVLFPYFGKRYKLTPQKITPTKTNVSPEKLIEQITELKQVSAALQTDLEERETIIKSMTTKMEEQESKASVMEAEINRLKELTKPKNVVNAPMPEVNNTEQLQEKVFELEQQMTVAERAKQALQQQVVESEKTKENLQQQIQELQQQVQQQQAKSEDDGEKSSNFMAVIIQWPSLKHDVDLEVQSPSGKKYNFKKRKYKGNPAQFTLDSRTGPGSEVWQTSELEEGTYKVRYNFYNHYGNKENAKVDARVFTKKGAYKIPTQTLEFPKKRKYEFQFTVNEDGAVKTQL